jgi:hypothetical protein
MKKFKKATALTLQGIIALGFLVSFTIEKQDFLFFFMPEGPLPIRFHP